ncbi:MAG: hypothetical protein OXG57_11560 [Acidimicrobiaceae bacterium]|nr:hypothetical protein [Acidimicrobiaceae bacterium]
MPVRLVDRAFDLCQVLSDRLDRTPERPGGLVGGRLGAVGDEVFDPRPGFESDFGRHFLRRNAGNRSSEFIGLGAKPLDEIVYRWGLVISGAKERCHIVVGFAPLVDGASLERSKCHSVDVSSDDL